MANSTLPNGTLKTKHVASHFGIRPVQLRRVLRSMERYADGVHTNYRWTMPADKKLISEIGNAIKEKAIAAETARKTAQAELKSKTRPVAKSVKRTKSERKSKIASDPIAERQQQAQAQYESANPETENAVSA